MRDLNCCANQSNVDGVTEKPTARRPRTSVLSLDLRGVNCRDRKRELWRRSSSHFVLPPREHLNQKRYAEKIDVSCGFEIEKNIDELCNNLKANIFVLARQSHLFSSFSKAINRSIL